MTDITYIHTRAGGQLAAVLDRYSRQIVGWAMSKRMDTALGLQALAMAVRHRQPPAGLLSHSDRGVQYAAAAYRHARQQAGLQASMSRKANGYRQMLRTPATVDDFRVMLAHTHNPLFLRSLELYGREYDQIASQSTVTVGPGK